MAAAALRTCGLPLQRLLLGVDEHVHQHVQPPPVHKRLQPRQMRAVTQPNGRQVLHASDLRAVLVGTWTIAQITSSDQSARMIVESVGLRAAGRQLEAHRFEVGGCGEACERSGHPLLHCPVRGVHGVQYLVQHLACSEH